jgi:hypothetical protein
LARTLPILALILTACWKPSYNEVIETNYSFTPASGGVSGEWSVAIHDMPFQCPDQESAAMVVVYPSDEQQPTSTTLLMHSASFDYQYIDGPDWVSYKNPTTLTRAWGIRRVFTTLGLYTDSVTTDDMNGAIAQALIEQGSSLVIPVNCWGDLWHNDLQEGFLNDVEADNFERMGRSAAIWGWRMMTEPSLAPSYGIELPPGALQETRFAVGLGEGGRGVSELINYEATFDGIFLDSSPDDLTVYYSDEDMNYSYVPGLERIFPTGEDETIPGSLISAPSLPDRTVYFFSTEDPQVPLASHGPATSLINKLKDGWVYNTMVERHIATGNDLELSRQAVAHMMDKPIYVDPEEEEPPEE